MKNDIVGLTVAAVCAIVFIGSVLVPNIGNFTQTEETFTNDGLWRMSEFTDDQTWEFSSNIWTLNSEEQISGATVTSHTGVNAVVGSDWCIRANGWIRGETISGNSSNPFVVVSNETVTVIDGNTSVSMDYFGYGVDVNGAYVATDYNSTAYVLGDSPIYATGQAGIGSVRGLVHFEGTIDGGITATVGAINGDSYTDFEITDVVVNYAPVDGYESLYVLSGITATASCDNSGTEETGTVSFTSFVVPYEVTAELSQHMSASEIALIGVIPLLAIVALVCAIAYTVFRNRDY